MNMKQSFDFAENPFEPHVPPPSGWVERALHGLGFATAAEKRSWEPVKQRRQMAQRPPSFTELLPYVLYKPDEQVFLLKDGSLGAMFELGAVPTEAQPQFYLEERASKVQEALQAIIEADDSPWIVQFFVSDDRNIDALNDVLRDYIAQVHQRDPKRQREVLESPLTQAVLDEMRKHLAQVSKPEGLFFDNAVSKQVWRGQQRRIRCCIYKRFDPKIIEAPEQEFRQIEAMAITLNATLKEAGLAVRRCGGKDLYEWLLPFFNPKPICGDNATLLRMVPYPGDGCVLARPATSGRPGAGPIFGPDLAEQLNHSWPRSDLVHGTFEFDDQPVRAMTLQSLWKDPQIGHFTAELPTGLESFARFDRMPPGTMLSISVAVRPQHLVQRHVERIREASRARNAQAQATHAECERVLSHMINARDKLFPMFLVLYLSAENQDRLKTVITEANSLLNPTGLEFINPKQDLIPLDSFIRGLPFNFDAAFDEKHMKRTRLTFASQIAALAPTYGRSRGTAHPNFWFWNRGGEPLWFDPLNKLDRQKNAHMLVFGPTGAGKSATLNYLALMTMTIHRPRLVIVDAGNSFGLLVQYFKELGLSTYNVTLNMSAEVSLPPFVNACRLLDDSELMESFEAAEASRRTAADAAGLPDEESLEKVLGPDTPTQAQADKSKASQTSSDGDEDEKRDLLGEMMFSAILMITGGEPREQERMTRADRWLVSRAIVSAALKARQTGKPHPLAQDVALALMDMQHDALLSHTRQTRAEEMGQAMMYFTQGLRGKLFNRQGTDWPDADVTLVEMGTLTKQGYGDALGVAYMSLLNATQSRGEQFQNEGRPLVFLTDEGHLITTNPLLAPEIPKATKMWRKLAMWFWLATQNLRDLPDEMERVLSMCEYWMLLTMDKSEIEQVARFRSLTPEQRHMMESARKETPKYTEGVLIDAAGQYLFRNVPPPLAIALAMTEGHEKAHRHDLMREHRCTELQAAMMVAEELAAKRA
jgi:conjugative transfer ATPase